MSTGATLLESIDQFVAAIGSTKSAESAADAGRVQNQGDSGTSHPSKSVDDGTRPATEGARSAENSADVKSSVPGQSVDSAKEDKMTGKSESPMTTAKMTGEDPANETSSASGSAPDDGGTSHPAKSDFGGKYASAVELLQRGELEKAAEALRNRIDGFHVRVAALTQDNAATSAAKTAAAKPAAKTVVKSANDACPKCGEMTYGKGECSACSYKKGDEKMASEDEAAGRQAAKIAAASLGLDGSADKQNELIESLAKEAADDADLYVDFLVGMHDGQLEQKRAEVHQLRKAATVYRDRTKAAMEGEAAGADAMAFGGDGQDTGGGDEGGGEMMPPEAGGGGDMMGGGGGGGEIEQVIAALEAAGIDPALLAQIDPADLAEALAGGGAEGAGGMEGGAGGGEGMPPEMMGAEGLPPSGDMGAAPMAA